MFIESEGNSISMGDSSALVWWKIIIIVINSVTSSVSGKLTRLPIERAKKLRASRITCNALESLSLPTWEEFRQAANRSSIAASQMRLNYTMKS